MTSTTEPYKATITIEITAPTRDKAPAVFAQALEAIGFGASEAEGCGREQNTYYRVVVEENQKGAPMTLEAFLAMNPTSQSKD